MESRFGIYRRLLGYLGPYWPYVVVAYTAMIATTLINLLIPQIIKRAIDQGLAEGQTKTLFVAAVLILGIAVVRGIVSFGQRYFGQWLTHRVAYDLRNRFYLGDVAGSTAHQIAAMPLVVEGERQVLPAEIATVTEIVRYAMR